MIILVDAQVVDVVLRGLPAAKWVDVLARGKMLNLSISYLIGLYESEPAVINLIVAEYERVVVFQEAVQWTDS